MLLDVRDAVGVARMAEVDLGERLNRHQPLAQLGPMAYAVLRVILERLAARDACSTTTRRRSRRPTAGCPGRAGRAAAVREHSRSRLSIRCVYTDLDGTLLGRGRLAVPRRRGRLHAARRPARSRPATAPGVEVVIKSGRRRAQVMEDARLIGQTSYIFEVGTGHGRRRRADLPHGRAPAARRPDDPRAGRGLGRARRCCSSATPAGSSTTTRGTSTARSRTSSAAWWTPTRRTRCSRARATATCAWWTTAVDRATDTARLPPDPRDRLEGARRRAAHAGARLRARGVHRGGRLARGPRHRGRGRALLPGGQRRRRGPRRRRRGTPTSRSPRRRWARASTRPWCGRWRSAK